MNKKVFGGPEQLSILEKQLEKDLQKRYEKISEINKEEREKVNANKKSALKIAAGVAGLGVAAVAAGVAAVAAGPVGLFALGAAIGTATASGAAGAGTAAGITALSPRRWFGKKSALKDKVKESQEDETVNNMA